MLYRSQFRVQERIEVFQKWRSNSWCSGLAQRNIAWASNLPQYGISYRLFCRYRAKHGTGNHRSERIHAFSKIGTPRCRNHRPSVRRGGGGGGEEVGSGKAVSSAQRKRRREAGGTSGGRRAPSSAMHRGCGYPDAAPPRHAAAELHHWRHWTLVSAVPPAPPPPIALARAGSFSGLLSCS